MSRTVSNALKRPVKAGISGLRELTVAEQGSTWVAQVRGENGTGEKARKAKGLPVGKMNSTQGCS